MVDTKVESPQQTVLKRLLQTEAEAQERRRLAQKQAMQIQTAGADGCEQLLAAVRVHSQTEAAARNQQIEAESKATLAQLAAANQSQITTMRQQAQAHMDLAVALVVDWVTGKDAQP